MKRIWLLAAGLLIGCAAAPDPASPVGIWTLDGKEFELKSGGDYWMGPPVNETGTWRVTSPGKIELKSSTGSRTIQFERAGDELRVTYPGQNPVTFSRRSSAPQ